MDIKFRSPGGGNSTCSGLSALELRVKASRKGASIDSAEKPSGLRNTFDWLKEKTDDRAGRRNRLSDAEAYCVTNHCECGLILSAKCQFHPTTSCELGRLEVSQQLWIAEEK